MNTNQTISSGYSTQGIYNMNNSVSCSCMLYYIIMYREAYYSKYSIIRYFLSLVLWLERTIFI